MKAVFQLLIADFPRKFNGEADKKLEVTPIPTNFLPTYSYSVSRFR